MDYIIHPAVFYLIDVCDNLLRTFQLFMTALVIICSFSIVFFPFIVDLLNGIYLDKSKDECITIVLKYIKKTITCLAISALIFVFMPTSDTIYKMIVSKQVTYTNVKKGVNFTKDTIIDIFESISKLNEEDKNETNK